MDLSESVQQFLTQSSAQVGKYHSEQFFYKSYFMCREGKFQSPIEHLFYIAANALCESQGFLVNPDEYEMSACGVCVLLTEQHHVGKFKVDFLLEQKGIGPDYVCSPVIVELDGHDFHDKNKKQRSYEKARDRHLVKSGYRVLHFTGSDVVKDPYRVAFEALEMIGVFGGSERALDNYSSADPLGLSL